MRDHPTIISEAGADKVADLVGASVHTVRSWIQRERIPPEHWQGMADAKLATLKELAAAAAANPRKRPTPESATARAEAA